MKKRFLFPACLLVSTLLCVLPCFFVKLFYLYGDDYLLNYIANGSFGEELSDHLIFLKYPLGVLLRFFYRLFPSVNWYEVLLIAALALAFGVIHACILSLSRHPAAIICSLICNAVAVPLFLTFTVSAFLSACAGFALVYVTVRTQNSCGDEEKYGKVRLFLRLLFGVLLILLGFCIRDNCLVPAAGLAFPSCILLLKKRETRLAVLKQGALAAVLLAALLFGTLLVEKAAYRDPAWQSFLSYNDARSLYLDYPEVNYDTFTAEYTDAGLTMEEWLLLHRWTFAEKKTFSEQLYRDIAAITRRAYSTDFRFRSLKSAFTSAPFPALLLFPLLLLLLFFLTDRSFQRWEGCLTLIVLYGLLVYLAFFRMRFLLRVTVPIVMCAVVFLSLSSKELSRGKKSYISLAVLCAAAVVLLVNFHAGYLTSVASLRSTKAAEGYRPLREEIDSHPERTYAVESPIFVYLFFWGHTVDEIRRTDVFSHVFRTGSWDSFSPRYYELAKRAGISSGRHPGSVFRLREPGLRAEFPEFRVRRGL